jgi:hypothetical protein
LVVPRWRGIKGVEASISEIIFSSFDITPATLFKTSSSVNLTILNPVRVSCSSR